MCVVNTAECLSQAENGRQQLHVHYSHKKNRLACDHTTGEVLTTSDNDYNNISSNT